ncbi:cyclin-dependent kinase 2-interacting protein-like [Asterias rubens]|uniref:cyclin-dependent kinase 2-interacting protein-like n=1 Tax=Asterias rubens TaxID=7604 RepID=UPI0014556A79|nr:cyclin-dependent kinase 2-interacting protein-like [Asterias rubens]
MSTSINRDRGRTPKNRRSKAQNLSFEGNEGSDIVEEKQGIEADDPVPMVIVPVKSPAGPLQGCARVIKDHCADWHNYIDKWNILNDKGLAIVNRIVTSRLEVQYSESPETCSMKDKESVMNVDSQGSMSGQVPDGLEGWCSDLGDIYKSMEKVVRKMAAITKHLKGICEMERIVSDMERPEPMFQTWPAQLFWEASCQLESMYTKELAVKKAIIEDVAHAKVRNVLMTYTSTWVHQPYIDHGASTTVESLLKETGHR